MAYDISLSLNNPQVYSLTSPPPYPMCMNAQGIEGVYQIVYLGSVALK